MLSRFIENIVTLIVVLCLGFVGAVLVTGVMKADASTPTKLSCTGVVEGGTYHSVDVPAGESCTLLNVTVLHNVTSLHGSVDVKVLDSTIGGNVHVKDATGLVHVGQKDCKFDPEVRVNVLVYDSHDVLICYVTGHNIQVKRNDGAITLRDNVAHRIDVSGNKKYVGSTNGAHRRPDAIRLLRNSAEQHIHVFHNKRALILRGNTPKPVVR